tara:strand:- start:1728 stop:2747 length:1020 start_codon:yes stop_codon:yes gene_type:complete
VQGIFFFLIAFKVHMLQPLNLDNAAQYQRSTLIAPRKGTGLPHGFGLCQLKLLGKGSNNAVYLYKTRGDQHVVVRQPRRKSDTQRVGNATWEFRNTAIAVQLGVAPLLYDAWYNRHSTTEQRGGLHIVCEHFPQDMHELLIEKPERVKPLMNVLRETIVVQLRTMADNNLFCYDLKPSNMVYRDSPFAVRFIDFGRDFCEWRQYSPENEYMERAPVLSFIQTIADKNSSDPTEAKKLYTDLSFVVMVLILSSNIAFTLDSSRTASRQSFADGTNLNFMANAVREMRQEMRGRDIALLKDILRQRDIRDTLRHYMGRRNCGTKRTFAYAGFTRTSESVKK